MRIRRIFIRLFAAISCMMLYIGISIPVAHADEVMVGYRGEISYPSRWALVAVGHRSYHTIWGKNLDRHLQLDVTGVLGAHLGGEVAVRRFSDERTHYRVALGAEQPLLRFGAGTLSLPQWYGQIDLIFLPEDYVDLIIGYRYRVSGVRKDPVWDRLSANYVEHLPYLGIGGRGGPYDLEISFRVGVGMVQTSFLAQPYNMLWPNGQLTIMKVW